MTQKRSKRYQAAKKLMPEQAVSLETAVEALKKVPAAKFDETVELSVYLGIDPKQSAQSIRGTVSLPHGTGKKVRILVFCKGEEARAAEQAGADYIGAEELINKVAQGWIDFDVVVAHPSIMKDISKLGKVLGPRGMMPSPKVGTVTQDIGKAVTELKKGKIEFKSDKTAGLHVPCGKLSFTKEALIDNVRSIMKSIIDSKPSSAKGAYLRSVFLSTTMGPGVALDTKTFGVV